MLCLTRPNDSELYPNILIFPNHFKQVSKSENFNANPRNADQSRGRSQLVCDVLDMIQVSPSHTTAYQSRNAYRYHQLNIGHHWDLGGRRQVAQCSLKLHQSLLHLRSRWRKLLCRSIVCRLGSTDYKAAIEL